MELGSESVLFPCSLIRYYAQGGHVKAKVAGSICMQGQSWFYHAMSVFEIVIECLLLTALSVVKKQLTCMSARFRMCLWKELFPLPRHSM